MSEDLIKREDAIKAALGITMYESRVPIDTVIYNIKSLPSADRAQGEWVGVEEDWRHQIEFWKCSECDFAVSSRYNFCPNCGARMQTERSE